MLTHGDIESRYGAIWVEQMYMCTLNQPPLHKLPSLYLHFGRDFLWSPNSFHGFRHDEIDNPHNNALATAQEYRIQNEGHNQQRAEINTKRKIMCTNHID